MTPTKLWDIYYHAMKEWIPEASDEEVRKDVEMLMALSIDIVVKHKKPAED